MMTYLSRGVLNWVYPDALHVIGAIARAVGEKRLPALNPSPNAFGARSYHSTVRSLNQLAQQMNMPPGERMPLSFSLLLIEPMLWTRFVSGGDGLKTQVHVSRPQAGDLVLISGEEVIKAVVSSRLTIGEAHQLGLIRLYGTDEQVESFLARYNRVGGAQQSPSDLSRLPQRAKLR
jgi:hypothetical protein